MEFSRIVVINTGGADAYAIARRFRFLKAYAVAENALDISPETFSGDVRGIVIAGNGHELTINSGILLRALSEKKPLVAFGVNSEALLRTLNGQIGQSWNTGGTMHVNFLSSPLFSDISGGDRYFENAYEFTLPDGFMPAAVTENKHVAAFSNAEKTIFGAQFSIESNDPDGMLILKNFAFKICGMPEDWTMPYFLKSVLSWLSTTDTGGKYVCAVSGSAYSIVSAAIALRAFPDRVTCVMLDTGLLRMGELQRTLSVFDEALRSPLNITDISKSVFAALQGASCTRDKHETVRREMLKALLKEGDVIIRGTGHAGAFELCPVSMLLRSEIQELGGLLGIPQEALSSQPFPESGLACRISGEATTESVRILRDADDIFRHEVENSNLHKKLVKYYVTLSPADDDTFAAILHALISSESMIGYAFRMPYDVIERTVKRMLTSESRIAGVMYDVTGR